MSRGVNRVTIIGNLGQDPSMRYTQGGSAICTFTVAVSEQWKDKNSGQQQTRTEWLRIKAFGRLAEICGEHLHRGKQVYIEGSIRTDKYTDKEGIERYSTDIIASEMQLLGGKSDRSDSRPGASDDSESVPF